jgi:scytalone dehydratase
MTPFITVDYDSPNQTQDWDRLRSILSPSLLVISINYGHRILKLTSPKVDYSMIGQPSMPDMESDAFIAMMSAPDFVGNPLIRTQHLLGAVSYKYVSEDEIIAIHQIRAAHQRYSDDTLATVVYHAHGYGRIQHWYKRVEGAWKLSGLRPAMYWSENEVSKIFSWQSPTS